MKSTKKIVSILLALAMVFAMAIPTFAAQEGTKTGGTITIDNAVVDQTYSAYQILYIESYNAATNAYSYKANSAWATWLAKQTEYLTINEKGYVTWKEVKDEKEEDKDARVANFAKLAQAEAAQLSADATATASATTVTFSNLKLGYYLVDTSLGTLCSLDTTKPSVTIKEKNNVPVPEKKVKEGETWADESYAKIGDTVEFKTTIKAKKGAQNYVLHDKMSEGFTLNSDSIVVKEGETKTLTESTDYTIELNKNHMNNDDGTVDYTCAFEITFTQTYLDTITADTDIIVTYSAILNDKAVISGDANINQTMLVYGENETKSEWDETKTYTFKFDIIKTDSNKKLLTGAKFELYTAKTGGEKIALVKESNSEYRVATNEEKNVNGFTSAVIEAGKVTVKGFDADTTYWLEETEAPDGYNKLSERVEVKFEKANLTTKMTGDTWNDGDGGIQITNNTGTELPSTGGIGTTIFYALGFILVVGAAVTLIVRRRMREE